MAAIPKPVLIITTYYQAQGQQMSNVSFWQCETPPTTQTQMDSLVAAASAAFGSTMVNCIGNHTHFLGCTGKYLSGTSILESSSSAGAGVGVNEAPPLPDQTAWIIDKQTAQYGRQYVGRYFIGGMTSDHLSPSNSNEVTAESPLITQMNALAEFLGADRSWGPSTCHARHWDRKNSQLIAVTKCVVRSRVASQRKRRRRQVDLFVAQ